MNIKISLAGDLGSGKSTVAKLLVDEFKAEKYSTGVICREVAKKHGLSVTDINKYMETHPEIDAEIDDGLKKLSERQESLIIDSRMAWHFVKNTYKVYLITDPAESAKRIFNDNRDTENFATYEDTLRNITERKASENKRYFELYGVDCGKLANYDIVIETTAAPPEEIARLIIEGCRAWYSDDRAPRCFLNPKRLLPPIDAENRADTGELKVRQENGGFRIVSGKPSSDSLPLVRCTLV